MIDLENWMSEITEHVGVLKDIPGLGLDGPQDERLSWAVASNGFPGVLPLWNGRRHSVGLLADPRTSSQSWAGVIMSDGQALTIASDARTILPQLIIVRALSKFPEAARELAEGWKEARSNAHALHSVLGGTEEELEVVVAAAADPASRDAFRFTRGQEAVFEAACSTLCRKVDRSETFRQYADWLDSMIAGRWTSPEPPGQYGVWARRVLCWASRIAFSQPAMPKLSAESLYQIVERWAGIDSGVPIEVSWSAVAGEASGETALTEAAMVIEHEPPASDEVSAGIVQALIAEGASYRGLAHAEAVVLLDERGESERAWDVLQSAAWWAARNVGSTPRSILEGARFLTERHNWSEVGWVVERALERSSGDV